MDCNVMSEPFFNLVVLHIAHIDEGEIGGVAHAVPGHVLSQESKCIAGLFNIADLNGSASFHVANYIPRLSKLAIENLSFPFNKPDIVVFHEIYRPAFLKIAKDLRRKLIPYIIVPHGGLTEYAQRIKGVKKRIANLLLFESFLREAELIQYLSSREADSSKFDLPFCLIPNGTDASLEKISFSKSGFIGIFVGRYDIGIKGIDLLLGAVGMIKDYLRTEKFVLHLYGPGDVSQIGNLISKNGIGDLVTVHGPVVGDAKRKALLSADCFMQTSRSEGMPMGLIEAMALGIPCLVSEGTGMKSFVEKHEAGWGCGNHIEEIAESIVRAISMRAEWPDISLNASRSALSEFAWGKVSDESLRIYSEVVLSGTVEAGKQNVSC